MVLRRFANEDDTSDDSGSDSDSSSGSNSSRSNSHVDSSSDDESSKNANQSADNEGSLVIGSDKIDDASEYRMKQSVDETEKPEDDDRVEGAQGLDGEVNATQDISLTQLDQGHLDDGNESAEALSQDEATAIDETQDSQMLTQDVSLSDMRPASPMAPSSPGEQGDAGEDQNSFLMTQDEAMEDVVQSRSSPVESAKDVTAEAAPESPAAAAKSGSDADSESEKGAGSGSDSDDSSPGKKKKLVKKRVRRGILSSDDDDEDGGKKSGDEAERVRSRSKSRSPSRSNSGSGSGSDSDVVRPRKKKGKSKASGSGSGSDSDVVQRRKKRSKDKASGSGSGSGSDSDVVQSPKKKRKRKASGSGSGSGAGSGSGSASSASSGDEKEKEDGEKDDVQGDVDGEPSEGPPAQRAVVESSSDDDGPRREDEGGHVVSDFDLMLERKKAERLTSRRRKRGTDIISDADDLIAQLINDMRDAAVEDRELNRARQPAIKKLTLLPYAHKMLNKADLQMAFLESNVLSVFTEWLAPMPDKSLPAQKIRTTLLRLLRNYPCPDKHAMKSSGIGKALMYLYRHPKETKDNRYLAGKIISEWSRPIFNNSANLKAMSKEEREARDRDQLPYAKKRRADDEDEDEDKDEDATDGRRAAKKTKGPGRAVTEPAAAPEDENRPKKPGDPGWIYRARVPNPSNKDYVNRPKWNSEVEMARQPAKKKESRYDKQYKKFLEKKRSRKSLRAVEISIEGRKMAL